MAFYRTRRALLAASLVLLTLSAASVPVVVAAPPRRVRVAVGRADYRFLIRSAQRGLYENRAARLAQKKAAQPAVRDFAGRLMREHGARETERNRLLLDKGLTPQNSPSAIQKRRLARLTALRGRAFDQAYLREAVRINREDATSARRAARTTKDRGIREFVRRFAPTEATHLKRALALRETDGLPPR